jgi:hypothetical protein
MENTDTNKIILHFSNHPHFMPQNIYHELGEYFELNYECKKLVNDLLKTSYRCKIDNTTYRVDFNDYDLMQTLINKCDYTKSYYYSESKNNENKTIITWSYTN